MLVHSTEKPGNNRKSEEFESLEGNKGARNPGTPGMPTTVVALGFCSRSLGPGPGPENVHLGSHQDREFFIRVNSRTFTVDLRKLLFLPLWPELA